MAEAPPGGPGHSGARLDCGERSPDSAPAGPHRFGSPQGGNQNPQQIRRSDGLRDAGADRASQGQPNTRTSWCPRPILHEAGRLFLEGRRSPSWGALPVALGFVGGWARGWE
jgi:hypothetical protein